jgi:hypothetical protein
VAVLALAVLVADRGGGAGRRGHGAVMADLVVAELAVVVVVREAAVPSSPRWWSRWPACVLAVGYVDSHAVIRHRVPMALKPLEQWYCDRCGEVIEKPTDGWVHWRKDATGSVHSIEILHHLKASPRGGNQGCYPARMDRDMHLNVMLGPRGIVDLLSMIDVGAYHDPEGAEIGRVKDIRNWVDVFRRLHVPYYEEARQYFDRARAAGEIDGVNEVALYTVSVLKGLVEQYSELGGDDE